MNYIQYMQSGGNFGDKLKTEIKKFLKAAGEASRMAKDARINNPGAAMIRDAYAKGDKELAKLLTDEMQAANLTGIALGSGAGPLMTGFTVAPVTTGATLATGIAGGMAGMYGTDKAINYFSDGKYTGWGDWVNQATNGVIGENTAGVFHPGAIFGGAIAGAAGNKIVSTTNRGKLESLNSELNKLIESSKLNKPFTKLDVLDGYLFHNGHVEVSPAGHNGEKYTYILREAKPGALKIEEGKYKSVRQPYGDNPDLIWWDAEGHNYGKKVYVTKLGNDATHVMSNMEDLPISQVIERYEPSYYVTKLKPVNSVIEYTFDPISGAPIPHMPGKVLNNKMSYEEILTHPVLLQSNPTPTKTSLAFFERKPAKISEAERLGLPKGEKIPYSEAENVAFRQQINDFAAKYGYEPIGDEVTDPEVLERYARSLIKRHNTFYRGVELNPKESNLSLEYMATHAPGGGAGELYITPYLSVAAMYGEPVEILRPYKLGADRTRWFDEGDFQIYTAGGRRDMHLWEDKKGIASPWLRSEEFEGKTSWTYKPRVETELTGRNLQFIPISVLYRYNYVYPLPIYRVGSLAVPTTAFYKSGGSIHIKKKNVGSFTRYCKGKVTEECIRKGKNSSNPTTRKRANFALVARHKFKHEEGGKLNYLNYFK